MNHPTRRRSLPAARGAILAALALTSGCPATLSDPDAYYQARLHGDGTGMVDGPPGCNPAVDVPALFNTTCGLPGCHAAATDASPSTSGLDLVSPGVASRLIGVSASMCAGQTLVSSDGTTGYLFDKLTMTHPPCGSPMPLGSMLTAGQISCIHAWTAMVAGATDAGTSRGIDAASMDAM